tara:strand:+ start:2665 stop:3504 length:840 start_codon:yes stop_codon:yes gene_type:complete
MSNTFSSFKESNLLSKKEWIYSNRFIYFMQYFTPFIFAVFLYDLAVSIKNIKKNRWFMLLIIIAVTYFISDFITAIIHCYYIDQSYSEKEYRIENKHIVIDTHNGYASCHHIFPSNWKDVSDTTIFVTAVSFFTLPLLFFYLFLKNTTAKLFLYFVILFIVFAAFTHKYAHEKLHKRYVPLIIDLLLTYNLFLSPKVHQKHHIENNYNWSLLNGTSDNIFNVIIHSVCQYFKKCPMEESVDNVKKYIQKENLNTVNIRFTGDIEGVIQCKLENNLFVKV